MGKSIKQETEAARFRQDIRLLLRRRVREAIEITLEERGLGISSRRVNLRRARAWGDLPLPRL